MGERSLPHPDVSAAERRSADVRSAPAQHPHPLLITSQLAAAARLVAHARDVLDARPLDGEPPAPLVSRGWSELLASLSDAELASLEVHGLAAAWPSRTPASLLEVIAEARAVCAVCAVGALPSSSLAVTDHAAPTRLAPHAPRVRETPRKRAQIEAFARVIVPLAADARRVVDVGAGHGHLTRDLAERLALPVVGLERDPAIVERAASLPSDASPSFLATDVLRDGLAFEVGDCVVGLHACGELGDAIVEAAAAAGGTSGGGAAVAAVALVGCCLQKRRQPARRPLCPEVGLAFASHLELPTGLLGLSNLTPRDEGVEASRESNLDARARRLALRRLLAERGGLALRPGAEMDGVNRRAAQRELPALVARVFAQRGLPAPTAQDVEEADRWSRACYARMRRFALPRALLGRALEVYVALDRARHLEANGFEVTVSALFPAEVSARNLVILARRAGPAGSRGAARG
jgi:SAM-dependent methyltransferase